MSRKHIGLIYAGGTVGMTKTEHGYAPMPDFELVLSSMLQQQEDGVPHYTLHSYATPIDSTNATPRDWHTIGCDIAKQYDEYDGFVVLHGTDTMAYTASALAYMLQGLRKPVIVTGAQMPLGIARSDAAQNVITSLQLAASGRFTEVAIYFNQRLLRGSRATKVSSVRLDAFDSPNFPWLAEVGINVMFNEHVLSLNTGKECFVLPQDRDTLILPVRFVPGLPTRVIKAMLALKPQAIILECYGSGNAPDGDAALLEVLGEASRSGVVVAACSQSPHGRVTIGAYAAGAGMTAAGVVGAGDMTFEAAFTKLHHLFGIGLTPEAVRADFQRNLSGELTD